MSSDLLTLHVRDLPRRQITDGRPMDQATTQAFWGLLQTQMTATGFLKESPHILGYEGRDWKSPSLKQELLEDAYQFTFLFRLRSLRAQLKLRHSLRSFLALYLQLFLNQRHALYDPQGYRLLYQLQQAALEAIEWEVWSAEPPVQLPSVLYQPAAIGQPPVSQAELKAQLTKIPQADIDNLPVIFQSLCDRGISAFSLSDLWNLLKQL